MRKALAMICLLALKMPALAAEDPYVPPELQPWKQWVMHGEEFRDCPMFFNRQVEADAFVCSWAEPVQLTVGARGGRFDMRVRTYTQTWVALPGDASNFPQEVAVDNSPAPVIEYGGQPAVYLAAGLHRISGRFSWTQRPETLGIPVSLALLQLRVDERLISDPERQGNRLWLGEPRDRAAQVESLDAQVYRKLSDGIPMLLQTQLRLSVAGGAREVELEGALPGGWLPTRLSSPLPARIEPDGSLRVQVRPGNWLIRFQARATEIRDEIRTSEPGEPWAKSEIWSYQADPSLRISNATGETPIDPGQFNVPGEWQQLPAFSLMPGQALLIEERSRGMGEQEGNRLFLRRNLWLDFDGRGLTARDRLNGQMRRDWRLDMQAPYVLASASSRGENLLVTQGAQPDLTGVELRSPDVALEATGRLLLDGEMPVTGWTQQVAAMRAILNLPPGRMLMATRGVDQSPDAWVTRWRLLDYFLVLVIAVAVRRLIGNGAGAVALLALAVTYHEPGAPVWSWLNLVVALALSAAVSEGRFARFTHHYRNASYLLVLVFLVPFLANQVRLALFPQLETVPMVAVTGYGAIDQHGVSLREYEMDAAMPVEEAPQAREMVQAKVARPETEAIRVSEGQPAAEPPGAVERGLYDPNALVQTGPGLPGWQWRRVSLAWNGPVEPDQTFRLIVLAPWQTAAWRVLGALLAAGLFYLLLRSSVDMAGRLKQARGGASAAAILGLALLLPLSGMLQAETPPAQILQELKSRLTEPPECLPRCAVMPSARVDATPEELSIELEIHALEPLAIPLPGHADGWQPDNFTVDGRPSRLLYRDAGGALWLPLDAGMHRVRLTGSMPASDSFQLPFPMRPKEVLASATGWELSGVQDQRMATGSLEFVRIKRAESGEPVAPELLTADRFAGFVRVTRVITLGLDWTVRSRVQRIAPERGAITVEIPLLPGESVTSENVPVVEGKVVAALSADAASFGWASALERSPGINLTAPVDEPWVEVWQIEVGHIWRAEFAGTPLIMPGLVPEGLWVPEYHPRPGESLQIDVARPQAVPGDTLAIDRVEYVQQTGDRSSTFGLSLDYRSTRGMQHAVGLPDGSKLESVLIDGREQQLRLDQGRLELPILPGTHAVQVSFRLPIGASWVQRLPAADLGAPASNVSLGFDLPRNRWVLATRGPSLGPAVLYWAELVVFVFLAWLLGRTRMTPLRTRDWLLLGLGFSTFSWGVLGIVTAWLFTMGWRGRNPQLSENQAFNLVQLGLALVSVAVLFILLSAIPMALLGNPDMHVVGNGSSMYYLRWFSDTVTGELPRVSLLSTPLWVYKALILLWSLWLSFALVRWLPWAWQSFRAGGYWVAPEPLRRKEPKPEPPARTPPAG